MAKLYLFPELAESEAQQLEILSRSSILKMPHVYGTYKADEKEIFYDVLLMEYLDGVNAGKQDVSMMPETARIKICEGIVDNLIAIHSTINQNGFGELSSKLF